MKRLYYGYTANSLMSYRADPITNNSNSVTYSNNTITDSLYYILKDHLGSYDAVVNQLGQVRERYSFDAWGNRRLATNWKTKDLSTTHFFDRGFTGHEHLDHFELINMNGRLYDPVIGRFLSPDNYVADNTFTQDFNRYSYARNNPLLYTDPDGEFIFSALLPGVGTFIDAMCWGALIGGVVEGTVMAGQNGMTFWDGFGKGAITGAIGGLISPIGGGGISFGWNLLLGVGEGMVTGGLNAALGGTNILQGMTWGAVTGALFATITSDELSNLVRGKGFKSNQSVFENFSAGLYTKGDGIWQQDALEYFGFEGKYDPVLKSTFYKSQGYTEYWGNYNYSSGQISYGNLAFEDFATLKSTYYKELYHSYKASRGLTIERLPADLKEVFPRMDIFPEETYGFAYEFKQQGLFINSDKKLLINQMKYYQNHLTDIGYYSYASFPRQNVQWLYKIPRRW